MLSQHTELKIMEKKIYEYMFGCFAYHHLDDTLKLANGHARGHPRRLNYKKSAAVGVDDKEPPSSFYIHFSR